MPKIFKYKLNQHGVTSVTIKGSHQVLSAGFQGGDLVVWVLMLDPDQELPEHKVTFHSIFTGEEIQKASPGRVMQFIETLQSQGFVFHIFVECSLAYAELPKVIR